MMCLKILLWIIGTYMACFPLFLIEADVWAVSLETTDKIMDLVFSVITDHVLKINNYIGYNINSM